MRKHRRLHRRERKHRNKVIVLSLFGLILLLSCGYAAFQTSISLTARGTIKNVYTVDDLKKSVVTSNDGLYKDIYEDNRYIYKGTNPNNYVSFNNEVWRIISIESNNTIKIIRNESITNMSWDTNDINTWSTSSLNEYLNNTYYDTLENTKNIENHTWNVGTISSYDLDKEIAAEKETLYSANIGLIGVTDYIRANSDIEQCGTHSLSNTNSETCSATNWLSYGHLYWTIVSNVYNNTTTSWFVGNAQSYCGINIICSADVKNNHLGIHPVLYLSSDIKLSGTGEKNNLYQIK